MGMAVGGIVNLKYIPSCHKALASPPARNHLFPLSTQHEKPKALLRGMEWICVYKKMGTRKPLPESA